MGGISSNVSELNVVLCTLQWMEHAIILRGDFNAIIDFLPFPTIYIVNHIIVCCTLVCLRQFEIYLNSGRQWQRGDRCPFFIQF